MFHSYFEKKDKVLTFNISLFTNFENLKASPSKQSGKPATLLRRDSNTSVFS